MTPEITGTNRRLFIHLFLCFLLFHGQIYGLKFREWSNSLLVDRYKESTGVSISFFKMTLIYRSVSDRMFFFSDKLNLNVIL